MWQNYSNSKLLMKILMVFIYLIIIIILIYNYVNCFDSNNECIKKMCFTEINDSFKNTKLKQCNN